MPEDQSQADHNTKVEKTRAQKARYVFFKYVLPFLVAVAAITSDVVQIANGGH